MKIIFFLSDMKLEQQAHITHALKFTSQSTTTPNLQRRIVTRKTKPARKTDQRNMNPRFFHPRIGITHFFRRTPFHPRLIIHFFPRLYCIRPGSNKVRAKRRYKCMRNSRNSWRDKFYGADTNLLRGPIFGGMRIFY